MSRSILAVAAVLLFAGSTGCQSMKEATEPIGQFGQRLFNIITNKTPGVAAGNMEDTQFPDNRWHGINELARNDFAKREPYTTRFKQIAETDKDYFVRATAIRSLNRARDSSATDLFIRSLNDPNNQVRLEAAKALANVPDEKAVPSLLKIVGDPTVHKDVRIAAADALRHYRSLEVARGLVRLLSEREFAVAWQCHNSLTTLTGRDLRYDESAWLAYLTGPDKPFS